MDIVDELRAFVATAQTGSFTAAAAQLGVSNRLTSKYVAELESRLGVRLLQRTTRRVGLSPAGESLLARAPALLDELDDLLAEVAEGSRAFSGMIRISAPVTFGEMRIAGMLGRFQRQNPGLVLDLRLNDAHVDLAAEGIDLAFRLGGLDRLSLKSRKLAEFRSLVAASPAYLAARGTPETPEDLAGHDCILDTNRQIARRWEFRHAGEEHVVTVEGRLMVNSARAAVELAADGHGIVNAPRFALEQALDAGRLVQLLPDYETGTGPVSAVWLEGRALPRKIRALIDFAAEDLSHR